MDLVRRMLQDRAWRRQRIGSGEVALDGEGLRLLNLAATQRSYSDAQIDDYQLRPPHLLRQPPLTLRLRARFSHPAAELRGTAGFGFWNYPSAWPPQPPRAIWFFQGAPPHNLPLALGVPGNGWKAATIDLGRPQALAWLPPAALLAPLMRLPRLYRLIWPRIQRAIAVAEAPLAVDLTAWHSYEIRWGAQHSAFFVDGEPILLHAPSPRGPLCMVIWIDNQYLIATPQGQVRWGLVDAPAPQWLQVSDVTVTTGVT